MRSGFVGLYMQDYESLCAAATIYATLLSTQTHRQHFNQLTWIAQPVNGSLCIWMNIFICCQIWNEEWYARTQWSVLRARTVRILYKYYIVRMHNIFVSYSATFARGAPRQVLISRQVNRCSFWDILLAKKWLHTQTDRQTDTTENMISRRSRADG